MNPLNENWVLWFHAPKDENWDLESYKKIMTIETIEDYWKCHLLLTERMAPEGMFFLMKDGIDPIWENTENKNGGCWSFKFNKKNVYNDWIRLSSLIVSENITKTNSNEEINGISISPKKSFCIVKIWNKNKDNSSLKLLNDCVDTSQTIYRAHNTRM